MFYGNTEKGLKVLMVSQAIVICITALFMILALVSLLTNFDLPIIAFVCGFTQIIFIIHILEFEFFYSGREEFPGDHERYTMYSMLLFCVSITLFSAFTMAMFFTDNSERPSLFSAIALLGFMVTWDLGKITRLYHLVENDRERTALKVAFVLMIVCTVYFSFDFVHFGEGYYNPGEFGESAVFMVVYLALPAVFLTSRGLYFRTMYRIVKRFSSHELVPRPAIIPGGMFQPMYPVAWPAVPPSYGAPGAPPSAYGAPPYPGMYPDGYPSQSHAGAQPTPPPRRQRKLVLPELRAGSLDDALQERISTMELEEKTESMTRKEEAHSEEIQAECVAQRGEKLVEVDGQDGTDDNDTIEEAIFHEDSPVTDSKGNRAE